MSVTVEASSVSYDCNGGAQDFPVPFKFLESDDLLVRTTDDGGTTYTTLVEDVDYTVENDGDAGGTVSTIDTFNVGTSLSIERNTDILQETSFPPQGAFSAPRHETAYDKLTLICQELDRRIAALEALADLVDVTVLAEAVRLEEAFLTGDDVEDTFPLGPYATGGSTVVDAWCTGLANADDPAEVFDDPPAIQFSANDDGLTLMRVSGLKPNTHYVIRVLALYPAS